jgi:hypothetical protein
MRCLGATQALLLRLYLGPVRRARTARRLGRLRARLSRAFRPARLAGAVAGDTAAPPGPLPACRAWRWVCCCSSALPCRPCCSSRRYRRCVFCDANWAVRASGTARRLSARFSGARRTDVLGGRRSRARRLRGRRLQRRLMLFSPLLARCAIRLAAALRGGGRRLARQGSAGVTGWRAWSGAPTPASCRSSRWRSVSWRCCC